ncbi:acetolactate synthase 2 small subunit [Shewanella intestini]|uniref:Acetolactate synthase 2 small subunit n=1 Tax=Shewanella intestini TaxID=2017544 RepID=A0ABS5I2F8_9GAMM|nr:MULTISPECIES: acetolactate synthase 2 small subunit [Shewanella]MBR9728184.1 acetolactate synthase 2 small subunit [Shewanella intestini]MRG36656.1 acetolactate synthase 2 small subunit [Shewanella sp. XMDDZSB0408]
MKHTLFIVAKQRPEVLERLLRVTRHRGFSIINMQVHLNDEGLIEVNMQVQSARAVTLLSNQLDKLIDVTCCEVLNNANSAHCANE